MSPSDLVGACTVTVLTAPGHSPSNLSFEIVLGLGLRVAVGAGFEFRAKPAIWFRAEHLGKVLELGLSLELRPAFRLELGLGLRLNPLGLALRLGPGLHQSGTGMRLNLGVSTSQCGVRL